ncbi:2-keto-4-pentenoate hydratase/2-oxohepta-3-ene-1,7-dioic acid hydratase in catechol pathway [Kibdelosporangium banguiense]|uniref:2-keto-4-pentenoate hydratase/2-oxohepta-3-ene-1,7-dioic acid hydratase in catechol pathway n=1 Tax=Kibdelosporangium banguiense TaxID=1365924 RepID=A0ABS4TZV3_9PSEU|nr:fumarylacetoacetate hydrolase family protein [Kibdelosporangium banguiense]MBP2329941.1 2-keto-4-pentenoate hydratase/2-oxohepta-3-ene-1,7-dioic acid hydratase in catechol pathway [Kibdelosporangium banguiense]
MHLMRLGGTGEEKPVVRADDGTLYDISGLTGDIDGAFLAGDGIARVSDAVAAGSLPVVDDPADGTGLRVGSPVVLPTKVVCIGLNYREHAAESGAPIPAEPVVFMKAPDCVVGPYDEVLIPRKSTKTDWEVELAVVIGKTARYLDSPDEALDHVAGYTISNDVSEREFQLERPGGQWDKGKSCETFNPLGPWLLPASEVASPQELGLRLWVNNELKQDSSTKDMIFTVAGIVHFLSQVMVLRPGDVINTGTPQGVALGQPEPKPYLRAGDVVELEIEGLGRQRQTLGQA